VGRLRVKAGLFAQMEVVERFIAGDEPDFIASHLNGRLQDLADVHMLYFCDENGRVRWGRIEDPTTHERIALRTFPTEALAPTNPLLEEQRDLVELSYLLTERGIMLAAAQPVYSSADDSAQSGVEKRRVGVVLIGHFLDEGLRQEIEELSSLSIGIWDITDASLDEREHKILDRITPGLGKLLIDTDEDGDLYAYKSLRGLAGLPEVLLRTKIEKGILARGKKASDYLQLSTIATSILIFIVILRVLQQTVLNPLRRLTQFAIRIAETDDTTARIGMDRPDEIGILSREFDRMIEEIESSRAALVGAARKAGMSEIASAVLHNVGNVLNSVNVAATLLRRQAHELATDDLQRAVAILDEKEEDLAAFLTEDSRGKHMLPFFRALRDRLNAQQEALRSEADTLCRGCEHIAVLVRSQQEHTGAGSVIEMTSLTRQVDSALRIIRQAHIDHDSIEIVREYEPDLPQVPIDTNRVIEILINLIQNAKQSVSEADRSPKRIVLRVGGAEERSLRIEVEDNGKGIDPSILEEIFAYGFTTREDGHGYGLHASANSALEMGCTLRAESDGLDRGAKFILNVPVDLPPSQCAA